MPRPRVCSRPAKGPEVARQSRSLRVQGRRPLRRKNASLSPAVVRRQGVWGRGSTLGIQVSMRKLKRAGPGNRERNSQWLAIFRGKARKSIPLQSGRRAPLRPTLLDRGRADWPCVAPCICACVLGFSRGPVAICRAQLEPTPPPPTIGFWLSPRCLGISGWTEHLHRLFPSPHFALQIELLSKQSCRRRAPL